MASLKSAILSVVGPRLLDTARIAQVHQPAKNFRFLELEAEVFKTAKLGLGDKVQINVGNWQMRTYTPISLDAETGHLGILAYLHGQGPGSAWAENAKTGDTCQVLGPKPALKNFADSFAFFGDETSLATVANLQRQLPASAKTSFFLETTEAKELNQIIRDLGLKDVQLISKDSKGPERSDFVKAAIKAEFAILSGRAQSIRQVRDSLREEKFPLSLVSTKVYWSEGRSGLD